MEEWRMKMEVRSGSGSAVAECRVHENQFSNIDLGDHTHNLSMHPKATPASCSEVSFESSCHLFAFVVAECAGCLC